MRRILVLALRGTVLMTLALSSAPAPADYCCSATCETGNGVSCCGNQSCYAGAQSVTCVSLTSCGPGCTTQSTQTINCSSGGQHDPHEQEP